jgi:hypothetical protein
MTRPNFFLLLGLDPAAPWDQATYERALADSRTRWSRQSSGIKDNPATVEAKRNLALIRDIKGVLLNPATRDAERAAAREAQAGERRTRQDRQTERLDLMLAKGYLYDVERDILVTEGPDAAQIERIDAAEIRPSPQARPGHERLATETERTLKANLAIVPHRDLYQALATVNPAVTDTSSLAELTAAANALYAKARTIADKTRPEVGALQTLAGLARQVFGSAEQRRRHDFFMRVAPIEAIAEQYAADLAPVRRVDARQFEVFLRTAAEQGWDPALASEVFAGYLRDRGWIVETPPVSTAQWWRRQQPCPVCASLNDPAAGNCSRCGAPMRSRCPRCGEQPSARDAACPHCGFPVGQRAWVQHLTEEAEAALARKDPDAAAVVVANARTVWSLPPDSPDELAVRLRAVARQAERLQHAAHTSLAPITRLMEAGSYRKAMTRLRSLGAARSSAGEAMLASCEAVVQEADKLCEDARRPGQRPARRAELYLRAMELCTDHREALRELRAIPPAPPRRLLAVTDEERQRVRLTWKPAPDRGCWSVVVRVDGTVPPVTDTGPGLRRWVVRAGGSWEDKAPPVGLPMSYAVFTERDTGRTMSATAAVTSAPVLLTAPVTLTVRPGNGTAELSWTLPERATGVEIQREEVPPGAGPVCLTPATGGPHQLTDTAVRNGQRYRYTLRARYPCPVPGRPAENRLSSVTVKEITPGQAPEPPGQVYARGQPPRPGISLYRHKVRLSWPDPSAGQLRVVKTVPPGRPPAAGTELEAAELDKICLDGHHQLLEHDDVWLTDPAPCWYTPVLVADGRCYVGESRPYAPGPEMTGLAADYAGTAAWLTWTWPDGVTEALVGWDQTAAPPDPLAAARQQRISRADYDRAGGCGIPGYSAGELFIQVAGVIRTKDGEFGTSGTDVHAVRQPVRLRYEVRRGRMRRPPELVLRPDRPASLPEFTLHWRTDQYPAGHDDPYALVPPGRAAGELVVSLFLDRTAVALSCRLFLVQTADADMITIEHPLSRPTHWSIMASQQAPFGASLRSSAHVASGGSICRFWVLSWASLMRSSARFSGMRWRSAEGSPPIKRGTFIRVSCRRKRSFATWS